MTTTDDDEKQVLLPSFHDYFAMTQDLDLRPMINSSMALIIRENKLMSRIIIQRVAELRRYGMGYDLLSIWLRETFWLGRCPPQSEVFGIDLLNDSIDRKVLMRGDRYVVAENQVYALLCRAHLASSAHTVGENRSTHEIILSKFTHVSPDLITAFEQACPGCTLVEESTESEMEGVQCPASVPLPLSPTPTAAPQSPSKQTSPVADASDRISEESNLDIASALENQTPNGRTADSKTLHPQPSSLERPCGEEVLPTGAKKSTSRNQAVFGNCTNKVL